MKKCPSCGLVSEPGNPWDRPFPAILINCPGGNLYQSEKAMNDGEPPIMLMPIRYECVSCGHCWDEKVEE